MSALRDAVDAIGRPTAPVLPVGFSTATRVIGPRGVTLIEGWTFGGYAQNDPEAQ